jgi:hypothetical protein
VFRLTLTAVELPTYPSGTSVERDDYLVTPLRGDNGGAGSRGSLLAHGTDNADDVGEVLPWGKIGPNNP